jgi:uncharacterized protein (DUF1697 family)
MSVTIALLRGINVGGKHKIKMVDLRDLFVGLRMTGAQTLLQSGNVVFETDQTDHATLAKQIEAGIEQRFGFSVNVLLRTHAQFGDVVKRQQIAPDDADPRKLVVMFLSDVPTLENAHALLEAHTGPETFHIDGTEVYLYYPEGLGRSKLTNALIERKLQVLGTARNWNTVTKLLALADSFESASG